MWKRAIVNYKTFNQDSFDKLSSKIGHSLVTFGGLEYDQLSCLSSVIYVYIISYHFALRTGKSQKWIFHNRDLLFIR